MVNRLLILILALCLPSFGSIALVQSNPGGSVSTTVTGAHQTITTSSVGFGSNTASGDLLVIVVWGTMTGSSASVLGIFTPVTSGLTWLIGTNETDYVTSSPRSVGSLQIWYVQNAPSISTSATTTVSADSGTGSGTSPCTLEFALFEFSGVALTGARDVFANPNQHSGGSPGANLTTTKTDVIISAYTADSTLGSNLSAGSGYTLGPNASVAVVGQVEYQTNVAPGVNAAFFSGTQAQWGAAVVAFSASVSGANVLRHKGVVF